tara:strand:+ start:896 stop:3913 length:3018 start_codon:yes stop_codon:yes gene_type:complete
MKEFEGQRRFNPAKLPTLGEPLQTLDITPQISRAFQEKQRMDQPYLRSLERNEKQEFENLQIEAENENRRAANEEATLNKLMAFAPTLEKLGQAEIKRRDQEAQIRGKMKAFDLDFSNITELPYYQEQIAALENSRMSTDAKAAEAFQRTQNYELARVYKSLNGAERIGFAKTYLAQKQAEWPAYLSEQLTSNNELQLNVGGQPFTPSTAEGAAQTAAAAKALYRQYILDNGMSGVNDFFLEENFTGGENGARTQTQKILAKRNKHDARMHAENNYIRITAENSADAKTNPATANGINVLNAIGLLQDKNGNSLDGFAKATKFKEHVEGLIESGALRDQADVMRYLGNTPDPVTKGSMANRITLVAALRLKVTERNKSDFNDYVSSKKAAYYGPGGQHENAMAVIARQQANPDDRITGDEYRELQRVAVQMTGTTDKVLADWWKHDSEHGQNFEENLQMIKEMADQGYGLTVQIVRDALGYTPQAEQYINIARGQANSQARTGGYSYSYKILRTAIQTASGYAGRDSEQVSGKQAYLLEDLHRQVKIQANRLMTEEPDVYTDARLAEQAATDIVLNSAYKNGLTLEGKMKNLKYSSGSNNEFDTYFGSDSVSSRRQSATQTVARIQKQLTKFREDHNKFGLDLNTPNAYVDPADLQTAAETYYRPDGTFNPDFRMPQGVKQLSALMPEMNQIQILQKLMQTNQVTAVGADGKPIVLAPPPSMDPQFKPLYEKGGVDAEILSLYDNAQSTLESIRVGASSPRGFQSARIPQPVGDRLVKEAESAGLSLATVAALEQNENAFQQGALPDGTMAKQRNPARLAEVRNALAANGIQVGHPDYENAIIAGSKFGASNLQFTNGRFTPSEAESRFIKTIRTQQAGLGDQSMLAQLPLIRKTFHPDTGYGYAMQGKTDRLGRPAVMTQEAATAFDRMVQDSGGKVKYSDIESAQRSTEKNRQVGGAVRSKHLSGNAIDIHGASRDWIIKNGAKYGWKLNDYPGSHGGHFDFN